EDWTNQNKRSLPTDFSSIGYDIAGPDFTSTFNSPRRFWNTEPPGPNSPVTGKGIARSEEHTSELQSRRDLVCRLLLEKKNEQTACKGFSRVTKDRAMYKKMDGEVLCP